MDAGTVVAKLHGLDPGFREICEALYPGLEPRAVWDEVTKSEPSSSDVHVNTPVWRNGRGNTKGRGRRKLDVDVKQIRHVSKADRKKLEHAIGLGTTGIGAGISAVALPKHLKELPGAMRSAKTGPSVGEGVKNAVSAVRTYSKPAAGVASTALGGAEATPGGIKTGIGALKTGFGVARRNPRISAGLAIGAAALHTANLGGEAIATHVLAGSKPKKPKALPGSTVPMIKAWNDAQALIVAAHSDGRITKAQALALGQQTYAQLNALPKAVTDPAKRRKPIAIGKAGFGYATTSGDIKLDTLKAPSPVKADAPHLTPNSINQPKAPKSGAGRKAGKTKPEGKKTAVPSRGHGSKSGLSKIDAEVEIAKVDEDKMQCFGWCSVVKIDGKDVVDKQADIIAIDEVEKAAYDYVANSRVSGDMHAREGDAPRQIGYVIESMVFTPEKIEKLGLPDEFPHGWWYGVQVTDDDVWADVKSGKRTGFSIHGSGKRTPELVMD